MSTPNKKEDDDVTRAACISHVSYVLQLTFERTASTYEGNVSIRFRYKQKLRRRTTELRPREQPPQSSTTDGTPVIYLDCVTRQIHSVILNGEVLAQSHVDDGGCRHGVWSLDQDSARLVLPTCQLHEWNTLDVQYTNAYNYDGAGVHHFTDALDQQEYIYTMCQPSDCRRIMPCFNEPSIRAPLTLLVNTPVEWTVVANTHCTHEHSYRRDACVPNATALQQNQQHRRTVRAFAPTRPLSTYLYAFAAGPFASVGKTIQINTTTATTDNAAGVDDDVYVTLYCRQSLASRLALPCNADALVALTEQGLRFFQSFLLDTEPYPFGDKYDYVFVPQFNYLGMEHPGCVTLNECFLFEKTHGSDDGGPSLAVADEVRRADTVVHEMAHMWFGNLVTPRTWSDIWLSESLATYLAALAVDKATRFRELAWHYFHVACKRPAYAEDVIAATTHPVVPNATSQAAAFVVDDIVYGKGAAIIKQLVNHVGMETFQQAMVDYLHRHAWETATTEDFLAAIARRQQQQQKHGSLDITSWATHWLRSSGISSLAVTWCALDGVITQCAVLCSLVRQNDDNLLLGGGGSGTTNADETHHQDNTAVSLTKHHTVQVAIISRGDIAAIQTVHVQVERRPDDNCHTSSFFIDVPQLVGTRVSPHNEDIFVYANWGDHAYVQCELDSASLHYALHHIDALPTMLLRGQVWLDLAQCAMDARIVPEAFVSLACAKLANDKDLSPLFLRAILDAVRRTIDLFVATCDRERVNDAWFVACSTMVQSLCVDDVTTDTHNTRTAATTTTFLSEHGRLWLRALMYAVRRRSHVAHVTSSMDTIRTRFERCWALCRMDPVVDARWRQLSNDDNTSGDNDALIHTHKQNLWNRCTDPLVYNSVERIEALEEEMKMFLEPPWQESAIDAFASPFFDHVEKIYKRATHRAYARTFMEHMFPMLPDNPVVITRARQLYHGIDVDPILREDLAKKMYLLQKARNARSVHKRH